MSLAEVKTKCPGLYCGRYMDSINGSMSWSDCGACPRGYRVNVMSELSECMPCENSPSRYDWEYLGFMAMLPLILHWFFIDLAAKERWFVIEWDCFYFLYYYSFVMILNYSNAVSPKEKSCCI